MICTKSCIVYLLTKKVMSRLHIFINEKEFAFKILLILYEKIMQKVI